jgi:hypothetical protein
MKLSNVIVNVLAPNPSPASAVEAVAAEVAANSLI